jgi:hypothetical protein
VLYNLGIDNLLKTESQVKSKVMSLETLSEFEVLYQFGTSHISYLEGKLLTILDASIQDREQRKALKDLVRQELWLWAGRENLAKDHPHNANGQGSCEAE